MQRDGMAARVRELEAMAAEQPARAQRAAALERALAEASARCEAAEAARARLQHTREELATSLLARRFPRAPHTLAHQDYAPRKTGTQTPLLIDPMSWASLCMLLSACRPRALASPVAESTTPTFTPSAALLQPRQQLRRARLLQAAQQRAADAEDAQAAAEEAAASARAEQQAERAAGGGAAAHGPARDAEGGEAGARPSLAGRGPVPGRICAAAAARWPPRASTKPSCRLPRLGPQLSAALTAESLSVPRLRDLAATGRRRQPGLCAVGQSIYLAALHASIRGASARAELWRALEQERGRAAALVAALNAARAERTAALARAQAAEAAAARPSGAGPLDGEAGAPGDPGAAAAPAAAADAGAAGPPGEGGGAAGLQAAQAAAEEALERAQRQVLGEPCLAGPYISAFHCLV